MSGFSVFPFTVLISDIAVSIVEALVSCVLDVDDPKHGITFDVNSIFLVQQFSKFTQPVSFNN